MPAKSARQGVRQLVGDLFVEDLLPGERDDGAFGLPPEAVDLGQRVAGVVEGDEETFLHLLSHHHGLKGIDIRAAELVLLLHLDGEELLFEVEFVALVLAPVVERGDGEDATIDAYVADLRFVRDAAELWFTIQRLFTLRHLLEVAL